MLLDDRAALTGPPLTDDPGEITIRRFERRRHILAMAKRRFARAGYDQVSLQGLAVAADMDWEDFAVHFRDKRGLLAALLEDGWKELLPRLADIASNSITAHSAILGILAYMAGCLQKDEDLARLLLLEGRQPAPQGGELGFSMGYRRFTQLLREQLARGQRDGSFRPGFHPHVAVSMLLGAFEGMLRDRIIAAQQRSSTPYSGAELMSAFDGLILALKG